MEATEALHMSRQVEITALAYDKRGKLLSVGRNSYIKTHPLQQRFARKARQHDRVFLHAEIDALIKARGKPVHRLVVIRLDRHNKPALAKPCECCQVAINHYGVREVEYTK